MLTKAENLLNEVIAAYSLGGKVAGALRYGQGHINDTFAVYVQKENGDAARFILQRISPAAFQNPAHLMKNICGVTEYLRNRIIEKNGDENRECMTVIPTRDGHPYYTDSEGHAWRLYVFVEGTVCMQQVERPEDFYNVGEAFGKFQQMLSGYPAETLYHTIEKFHDTRDRYHRFELALEEDKMSRAKEAAAEIEFVCSRQTDCEVLMKLLEAGELPLRVTHNDTKLNNVLIDRKTGKGICIIDLDTVMPGLVHNDFGDSIRFGANHCAEDETDLSKVNFSLPLFETYTRGFLSAAGGALTQKEKEYLPWGARLMTLECGIRFLTDYLQGDVYFRIHHPKHNLDRCRTQLKLVSDMERCFPEMKAIVEKYS